MKELLFILNIITIISYGQLETDVNQYMVFQPMINTASATSYDHVSLGGFYRNQWVGFKGAPEFFGFTGVFPVASINSSLTLKFFRDQIGANQRDILSIGYAYRVKLKQYTYLAFAMDGGIEMVSRDVTGLPVNDINDASITNYENKALLNTSFSSYLFNKGFYIGFYVPSLINHEGGNARFSLQDLTYSIHSGKEFALGQRNHINVSTLIKTSGGVGVHAELNALYQFYEKKIGVGASYRTTNSLVGVLKLAPMRTLTIGYAYQFSVSKLASYQNGSHELTLIYNFNKEKKMVKLYAPRF